MLTDIPYLKILLQIITYYLMALSTLNKIGLTEINEILKLQQIFHNNYLTVDFLHQLVTLYVRVIQSFQKEYFFMKTYFMEKMQFVLSRPETIRMLQQATGEPTYQGRSPLTLTAFSQTQQNQQFDIRQRVIEKQTHHYHYQQSPEKNKEMHKKIEMKVKVMRGVEDKMKELEDQVKAEHKRISLESEKVKDIQKQQERKLNERLANRKKKLRKKSQQIKTNTIYNEFEQSQPAVSKQQLIEAQQQLTTAVLKFTLKITAQSMLCQSNKEQNKGESIISDGFLQKLVENNKESKQLQLHDPNEK